MTEITGIFGYPLINELLIMAGIVFGFIGGIAYALLFGLRDEEARQKRLAEKKAEIKPNRNWRKHQKKSSDRAALQARMMVETGVFSGPTRR